MLSYFQLCRIDAALIAFFSYLVGAELGGGAHWHDIVVAISVTLISTNFIYSFNSWADRELDRISKPNRPIPSGKIKPSHALIYSLVLLVFSFVYPWFVYKSYLTLFLFLLLPILGLLYSAKPIRLRRYPIPAAITISLGLITPIMLGYFMNRADTEMVALFTVLFLFCLSIVPLKKIEEVEEDRKTGDRNLYSEWGVLLLIWPLSGLLLGLILILFFDFGNVLKTYLFILIISSIACIFIFSRFKNKLYLLYQTMIYMVIIEIGIFYWLLKLMES
ncbi:MAG: UbiA family prenyltransferase [Deltaproteobacteria bacterium]|jgi:4-hydroxybenzoate polyprenyltransferase|nr:UbiA family prenyltransferase [Deltaproteobacteria bacterium]